MFKYRLVKYKRQRGRSLGVSLDWFTNKQHQRVYGSKIWGYINIVWKTMAKAFINFHLAPLWNYYNLTSSGRMALNSLTTSLPMLGPTSSIAKACDAWMPYGIMNTVLFSLELGHKLNSRDEAPLWTTKIGSCLFLKSFINGDNSLKKILRSPIQENG